VRVFGQLVFDINNEVSGLVLSNGILFYTQMRSIIELLNCILKIDTQSILLK
jgi:hypothetical protein